MKSRATWIAEPDINLMSNIFAVPRKGNGGDNVQDQQGDICKECAALIATKLLELAKLGNTLTSSMQLKRESPLMALVRGYVDKPASLPAIEASKKRAQLRCDGAARPKGGWRGDANVSS